MFTKKDIEFRSIFLINCLEERHLKLRMGELLLLDETGKTMTKFPFQKILALFVIGNATITTPLIDKCRRYGVFISVMKINLRPVYTFGVNADANFLLRENQYKFDKNDISIAKLLIRLKLDNELILLKRTRGKDEKTSYASAMITKYSDKIEDCKTYKELMGIEGISAKAFFSAYYQDFKWSQRLPRTKINYINVLLDIGYTMLFNFLESYARLFGFDIYVGVYHRQWFKRKSLLCDLIEPFRCIIDSTIRKSLNLGQFKARDFKCIKGEYFLSRDVAPNYYQIFMQDIVKYKREIFSFFQGYYKFFMGIGNNIQFPSFQI